jgi:hypothetical protein
MYCSPKRKQGTEAPMIFGNLSQGCWLLAICCQPEGLRAGASHRAATVMLRALDVEMPSVNATAVDQLLKTPGGSFEHLIN